MDLNEFLKGHQSCCGIQDVTSLASALETFWVPQHDEQIRQSLRARFSKVDSQLPVSFPE